MYDMGHAVMAWTLTTVVACKYGGHTDDIPVLLRRALAAPPLWILFLALALNVGDVPLSRDLIHYCLVTGQAAGAAGAAAMGLLVSAAGMRRREVIASVALRSGFGGLVGFTLALLFGLDRHRGRSCGARSLRLPSGSRPWCCRRAKDSTSSSRRAPRRSPCSWARCGFRWR